MNSEMLEILMGKHLDGQITAEENRMLEEALEADNQARELFVQLQGLHQQCEEAVSTEVTAGGRPFEEIFDKAWQRRGPRIIRAFLSPGTVRFVTGLAAGILIGLGVHLFLSAGQSGTSEPERGPIYMVDDSKNETAPTIADVKTVKNERPRGVTRNVEWYSFPDDSGNEYIVEGYRENVVKPAVYRRSI